MIFIPIARGAMISSFTKGQKHKALFGIYRWNAHYCTRCGSCLMLQYWVLPDQPHEIKEQYSTTTVEYGTNCQPTRTNPDHYILDVLRMHDNYESRMWDGTLKNRVFNRERGATKQAIHTGQLAMLSSHHGLTEFLGQK